jgi:hypothetical protein
MFANLLKLKYRNIPLIAFIVNSTRLGQSWHSMSMRAVLRDCLPTLICWACTWGVCVCVFVCVSVCLCVYLWCLCLHVYMCVWIYNVGACVRVCLTETEIDSWKKADCHPTVKTPHWEGTLAVWFMRLTCCPILAVVKEIWCYICYFRCTFSCPFPEEARQ